MKTVDMDAVDVMIVMYDSTDYNQETPSDNPDSPYDVTAFTGAIRATLNNIKTTWPHIRVFVMSPTYAQYKDADGNLYNGTLKDLGNGTISSYIENLEYLVKFEASGKAIGGEVPTTIKQLKHLKSFYLINTSVTKIPDDMFNENFQQIYITGNERLGGALPSSLSKLKGGESFNPKIVFLITNNVYFVI